MEAIALLALPVAFLLGIAIGIRRERGLWQRIRRVEQMRAESMKSRRGVKLSTISFRR